MGIINQLSGSYDLWPDLLIESKLRKFIQISAIRKDGFPISVKKIGSNSDRLNISKITALAIENEISLSNLGDVQMSYFNQAIENISYLRAQTSATKSRLEFTSDLEYENKSLTNKAYGRIADVDYALESSSSNKTKNYDFRICRYDSTGKYDGRCSFGYAELIMNLVEIK